MMAKTNQQTATCIHGEMPKACIQLSKGTAVVSRNILVHTSHARATKTFVPPAHSQRTSTLPRAISMFLDICPLSLLAFSDSSAALGNMGKWSINMFLKKDPTQRHFEFIYRRTQSSKACMAAVVAFLVCCTEEATNSVKIGPRI